MKHTAHFHIHLALGILLSLSSLASVAVAQETAAPVSPIVGASAELKRITRIASENTGAGSRVMLTFDGAVTDYGAYRNGNKYIVLVPGGELALSEIVVKGDAFSTPKVEARGTNLLFSFELESTVKASVKEDGNQLEVVFSRTSTAATTETAGTSTSKAAPVKDAAASSARTATAAAGDAAPIGSDQENVTLRQADLAVPESPAFTVLGVTPETVVRPTTPREFATSLLNGVDQRGNFQTGLALDFVPFLTFFGEQTSLFSYRNSKTERFMARTQISFATTKGVTDEDKATRLALGIRMTLWDRGDPRLDRKLDDCYTNGLQDMRITALKRVPGESDVQTELREKQRTEVLGEIAKTCNDEARKRNWNASGWIVGAAPSWISESGETKNYHWNGAGVWTSLAYGFENVSALRTNSQLIFHARYRSNEVVPDADNKGKFLSQDSLFFGSRLRIAPGAAAKSIFSLEGNFVRSRLNKGTFDNSSRFSLGFEQRVAENLWFSLALGGQSGRADGRNSAFVLSSFKWGFDQKK